MKTAAQIRKEVIAFLKNVLPDKRVIWGDEDRSVCMDNGKIEIVFQPVEEWLSINFKDGTNYTVCVILVLDEGQPGLQIIDDLERDVIEPNTVIGRQVWAKFGQMTKPILKTVENLLFGKIGKKVKTDDRDDEDDRPGARIFLQSKYKP